MAGRECIFDEFGMFKKTEMGEESKEREHISVGNASVCISKS